VKLLCIAGFLGSGKTTVLLELARTMTQSGLQLAIVENEIGDVGVDGGYVREAGLPVQELFGGCICCTLQTGLVETLRALELQYAPDWVVVEPTGLAAPGDLMKTVRVLDLADNGRAFSYAAGFESLHGSWRRMNDFMLDRGLVTTRVDSAAHLDADFIRRLE